MFQDFKKFAMKGNVLDLAVAVIIGGAFGKIVSSFVNDVIMPLIGVLLGQSAIDDLKYVITPETETTAELAIRYGVFLQAIVDFVIIAFVLFIIVRYAQKLKKKEEELPSAPPEPPKDIMLLTEIRDLLKK